MKPKIEKEKKKSRKLLGNCLVELRHPWRNLVETPSTASDALWYAGLPIGRQLVSAITSFDYNRTTLSAQFGS